MPDLKNKHLTFDNRLEIQEGLNRGETFKAIAVRIGKAQTTISREVKRHLVIRPLTMRRMKEDGTPCETPPCPKRGQHLYHISQTHDLGVSKSTVYRHLHRGYLSVSAVDFPRVVKFKPRQAKKTESIPREAKKGRTYEDFRVVFLRPHAIIPKTKG